ncbi:MAG: carboxypeptidase-like regulatory domain-containing protein [Kofleriaceae bacterium]
MAPDEDPWKVRGMRCCLVILTACGAASVPTTNAPVWTEGTVEGIARDKDTGDVIGAAKLHLRAQGNLAPIVGITKKDGTYTLPHLKPGAYSLVGIFAGQQVDIENIEVKAHAETVVDLEFTLGHPDPITVDFGSAKDSAIESYDHRSTLIEGTISDRGSRDRVAGAAVTATTNPATQTLMTVSDDQGRYKFDQVPPGVYVVSAYYSVANHANIEVRRSDIHVDAHHRVIVPLWVETSSH